MATPESERAYLERLGTLLELEAAEEAARAKARAERLSPADAEAAGISLVDLVVADEYSGLGGLQVVKLVKRNRTLDLPWSRIDTGSPVVLTTLGLSLRGVVANRKRDQLSVALQGGFHDLPEDAAFRLDLSSDEVTTARQRAALARVMAARDGRLFELRQVIFGRSAPALTDDATQPADAALNAAQQAAVRLGLQARDVALIHGPPGTGKTRTLVALIRAAVARGEQVLATAPSNLAVDNMMERLVAAGVRVVRLGHPARVLPELADHTLAVQVAEHPDVRAARKLVQEAFQLRRKADKETRTRMDRKARGAMRYEAKQLLKDARRMEQQAIERILDGAQVVCATTSVDPEILGARRFDLVAVDEAAQSTEPGTWPPVLMAERVVLAGDHRQLPPTVVSPEAAAGGFALSLFERLMERLPPSAHVQLTAQYRMHAAIMGFSNRELYAGTLTAAPEVEGHLLSDLPGVEASPLTTEPLELIDTAGAGWDEALEPDGESRRNPDEAELVAKKVQALVQAGLPPGDIGVITPYAAQARLLRGLIADDRVEVDTVDGFQGREKEAIVISLVRSNPDQELGFLTDVRRMNVALTRARRKLLVVGDGATLSAHPFYADLLSYVEAAGLYRSVWEEA
ncbi:MAG: AAA family ATPase [Deltaproteobacteria bacterium]|nr:AAA family ATPase [Deltaproteobacteria bacterium]